MTKLSPALEQAHRVKSNLSDATRANTYKTVNAAKQPLTVQEVTSLLAESGMKYDPSYIRNVLKYLVDTGKIFSREETEAERKVRLAGRSNYNTGAHFSTTYYWTGTSKKRTKHTDEIVKVHVTHRNTQKKKQARPARSTKKQTGISLMARIAELEARVAQLEKILG